MYDVRTCGPSEGLFSFRQNCLHTGATHARVKGLEAGCSITLLARKGLTLSMVQSRVLHASVEGLENTCASSLSAVEVPAPCLAPEHARVLSVY